MHCNSADDIRMTVNHRGKNVKVRNTYFGSVVILQTRLFKESAVAGGTELIIHYLLLGWFFLGRFFPFRHTGHRGAIVKETLLVGVVPHIVHVRGFHRRV